MEFNFLYKDGKEEDMLSILKQADFNSLKFYEIEYLKVYIFAFIWKNDDFSEFLNKYKNEILSFMEFIYEKNKKLDILAANDERTKNFEYIMDSEYEGEVVGEFIKNAAIDYTEKTLGKKLTIKERENILLEHYAGGKDPALNADLNYNYFLLEFKKDNKQLDTELAGKNLIFTLNQAHHTILSNEEALFKRATDSDKKEKKTVCQQEKLTYNLKVTMFNKFFLGCPYLYRNGIKEILDFGNTNHYIIYKDNTDYFYSPYFSKYLEGQDFKQTSYQNIFDKFIVNEDFKENDFDDYLKKIHALNYNFKNCTVGSKNKTTGGMSIETKIADKITEVYEMNMAQEVMDEKISMTKKHTYSQTISL